MDYFFSQNKPWLQSELRQTYTSSEYLLKVLLQPPRPTTSFAEQTGKGDGGWLTN